jgi:hypothetical protein
LNPDASLRVVGVALVDPEGRPIRGIEEFGPAGSGTGKAVEDPRERRASYF